MNIVVLYGTETGNAELVAEDVADAIRARGASAETVDLSDGATVFSAEDFYLVLCSTHGEGDLPSGALPFASWLDAARPNLTGIRYAVFGMGDSTYENYSRGSEHLDRRLSDLGASRVGSYGRHDANSRDIASDAALTWLDGVLGAVSLGSAASLTG